MSKVLRTKVILTPDIHRRLIQKDLVNLGKAVPTVNADLAKRSPLTTARTRVVSSLVAFTTPGKIAGALKGSTEYDVLQLENANADQVAHRNLHFSNGYEFVKWVDRFEKTQLGELEQLERPRRFEVNLNDQEAEAAIKHAIAGNDVDSVAALVGSDKNRLVFTLQHLSAGSHDALQALVPLAAEHDVVPDVLQALLKMDINTKSLELFETSMVTKSQRLEDADDFVVLYIKYDKLSRAKSYIDALLGAGVYPTAAEEYLVSLARKLEPLPDRKLKFDLLTDGFQKVYNHGMSCRAVGALLPYVERLSEFKALISFIDHSGEAAKKEIYAEHGRSLTTQYGELAERYSPLERDALLQIFKRHIQV